MPFTLTQAIVVSPTDEKAFVSLSVAERCSVQLITEAALAHNSALSRDKLIPLQNLFAGLFNSTAPLVLRGGAARTLMAKHHFGITVTCPVNDLDLLLCASNPDDINAAIRHHDGNILTHEQLGNDFVNIKFVLAGMLCDLTIATTQLEFNRCCQHVYPGNMIIPLNFTIHYPKRLVDDLGKRQISFEFGTHTTLDQLIRARRMEVYETLAVTSPPDAKTLTQHNDREICYTRLELKKGFSRGKGTGFLLKLLDTGLLYHFFPLLKDDRNEPLRTQLIQLINNIDILSGTEKNNSLRVYAVFIALYAKLTGHDPHVHFDDIKGAMPWLIPNWLQDRGNTSKNISSSFSAFQAEIQEATAHHPLDSDAASSSHGSSSGGVTTPSTDGSISDGEETTAASTEPAPSSQRRCRRGGRGGRKRRGHAATAETPSDTTDTAGIIEVIAPPRASTSPPEPSTPTEATVTVHTKHSATADHQPTPTPSSHGGGRRKRRGHGGRKGRRRAATAVPKTTSGRAEIIKATTDDDTSLTPPPAAPTASNTTSWWPSITLPSFHITLPSLPALPNLSSWWRREPTPKQPSRRARRVLADSTHRQASTLPKPPKRKPKNAAPRTHTRTTTDSGAGATNWTRFFPSIDKKTLAAAGLSTAMTSAVWYQLHNDALQNVAFDELFTQTFNFIAAHTAELPWHMHIAYTVLIISSVLKCLTDDAAEAETRAAPVATRAR